MQEQTRQLGESLNKLSARVDALEQKDSSKQSSNSLPLALDQALTGRGFIKDLGSVAIFGTITLSSGTATLTDSRIRGKSIIVVTPYNSSTNTYQAAAAVNGGVVLFNSSSGSDVNVLQYIVII